MKLLNVLLVSPTELCVFCALNFLSYRVMSLDVIMNTIDWVTENQGTRYFMFTDPSFSERRKFVKQFCNTLIEKDLQHRMVLRRSRRYADRAVEADEASGLHKH